MRAGTRGYAGSRPPIKCRTLHVTFQTFQTYYSTYYSSTNFQLHQFSTTRYHFCLVWYATFPPARAPLRHPLTWGVMRLMVGQVVAVRWREDGQTYPARVTAIDDTKKALAATFVGYRGVATLDRSVPFTDVVGWQPPQQTSSTDPIAAPRILEPAPAGWIGVQGKPLVPGDVIVVAPSAPIRTGGTGIESYRAARDALQEKSEASPSPLPPCCPLVRCCCCANHQPPIRNRPPSRARARASSLAICTMKGCGLPVCTLSNCSLSNDTVRSCIRTSANLHFVKLQYVELCKVTICPLAKRAPTTTNTLQTSALSSCSWGQRARSTTGATAIN